MVQPPSIKTLILGAGGQLGQSFRAAWGEHPHVHYALREEVDVTDFDALQAAFRKYAPQVVINCSGYTAVDRAEDEPQAAELLNVDAPERIARMCKAADATLVHFSTDYVFGGTHHGRAFTESDPVSPRSVYGQTKHLGEERVLATGCKAWVIRVSWLYSQFGKNFFKTMQQLAAKNGELRVVNDQVASPTWAGDVVKATSMLLASDQKPELIHFTNSGLASWYDFACEIVEQSGLRVPVIPVPTGTFATKAIRPSFSKLDTTRFFHTIGRSPDHWKDALTNCLASPRITEQTESLQE